jgi:tRNA(Ile)-lysidine synthase
MDPIKVKNKFYSTIDATINEFNMLEPNDSVLAAVSGGPDSVALVRSLLFFRQTYDLTLGIAHLNHQLRGEESLRDEQFVKEFAEKTGLPFFCERQDVRAYAEHHRLSVEEAGRQVRYDFFSRLSDHHGYQRIATGHNKNDNAELVLMNLLRGAGPKGLSGIPPVRNHLYIRPLIRVTKPEILDFLKTERQSFRIDASNTDTTYVRNAIRHRLIPVLEADYNPEIIDALDRLSHILRQEEEYLTVDAQKAFDTCLIETAETHVMFSKKKLSGLHPAIVNRVLRIGMEKVKKDLRRISLGHMNDILDFCFNRISGSSLDFPGQIRIYKKRDVITIRKEDRPLRELGGNIKN